jgi:fibronectin-binding autotransporter adhesin
MTQTKLANLSTMLADSQSGTSPSGAYLYLCRARSRARSSHFASHFGSAGGRWTATAHCRFLLLMFCLLLCLRGLAFAQTPETFMNTDGNGLWSDGKNWNPTTGSGGPNGDYNVTIPCCVGGPTGGAIMDVSASIVNLTIDFDASLSITSINRLDITGTSISNGGQLAIMDVPNFIGGGIISINNTVTLSGSGITYLDTKGFAGIEGSGTLVNQQTINGEGGGLISVKLENVGPNGQITGGPSTNPLVISGPVTNSGMGLISGLGFSTVKFGFTNTIQNAGGIIDGGGGVGQVLLQNNTIVGGTIGSASALPNNQGSGPTLSGVTITGTYSVNSTTTLAAETTLEGTITNNGKILVTAPSGGKPATLYIGGSILLEGTGQVTMSGQSASITGKGSNSSLYNVSPHVINGGNITGLLLTNQSEIFNPSMYDVELDNTGGTIEDPVDFDGGTVKNGTMAAGPNPGVTLNGGVTLSGVNITGGTSGVVNAVDATLKGGNTISTTVEIPDNDKLTLEGPVTVGSGGEILLDAFAATSTLVVDGSVTVSGTGELATSTSPNNVVIGNSGTKNSLAITVPTVNYQGTLGDGTFPITVGAPTTLINGGYPLIINATNSTFTNQGTMVGTDSTIQILGNFTNYNSTTDTLTGGAYTLGNATLQFPNANIVTNAAKLNLTGNGQIVNQNGVSALTNLNTTTSKGSFALSGDQNFTTVGTYTNQGANTIAANSVFTVGGTGTNYSQTGTTAVTTVDGRISVPAGGLTNITGGTLQASGQFDGDVQVGNATGGATATFIVGDSKKSSALVTMSNNYTQLATGVVDVQIGGTTAGSQYSQLSVTGNVTLGGTLNAVLINKFKPVSGDQFTIINAPSGFTGTFETVKLPPNFQVVYNSTSVVLEVQ